MSRAQLQDQYGGIQMERSKIKVQRSQIVVLLLLHAVVHVVERVAVIEQLPGKIKDQKLTIIWSIAFYKTNWKPEIKTLSLLYIFKDQWNTKRPFTKFESNQLTILPICFESGNMEKIKGQRWTIIGNIELYKTIRTSDIKNFPIPHLFKNLWNTTQPFTKNRQASELIYLVIYYRKSMDQISTFEDQRSKIYLDIYRKDRKNMDQRSKIITHSRITRCASSVLVPPVLRCVARPPRFVNTLCTWKEKG